MNNDEIKELQVGVDMSSSTGRRFKKEPAVNVISKEDFEDRIQKVFHLLWETLSKSFGPYGAPTIIYNYPWSHVTKDGYTIMKNLSMDASETLVDQAIADMAADVCGRLNYSVGDGTTSAVIATNSIFQNYLKQRDWLRERSILPRDILKKYSEIKETIIDNLRKKVRIIRSADPDELYQNIYDVVYVSSNGDELMTEYISEFYKELGCPAISCTLSPDGITRKKLINGYKFDMSLTDKLYVNSDDNTMKLSEADIIIFSTKITKDVYEKILVPLNNHVRQLDRHLIVVAPFYDEIAIKQIISRDLNNEYNKTKDVNMVLTSYKATSAHARRLVEDFAVLTNTTVIDRPLERSIMESLDKGCNINEIFNIDNRFDIPQLKAICYMNDGAQPVSYIIGEDNVDSIAKSPVLLDNAIRLGYARDISIGLKTSVISSFFYDKDKFDLIYKDAKDILEETERKYQKLGTFNLEVSQAQERYYSLNLKMGIIEVGADSELSQKLLKDAVDDAIKAAASAFNHGVINGCNVDLLSVIKKQMDDKNLDEVTRKLYEILYGGFTDVYRTVLNNAFSDFNINLSFEPNEDNKGFSRFIYEKFPYFSNTFRDFENLNELCIEMKDNDTLTTSFHDLIIAYSIKYRLVYDVSSKEFSDRIINSVQTDEEILKATIDLISILITGNQMVVTQKHNF